MQGKVIYERGLKSRTNHYMIHIRQLGRRRFVLEIRYKFVPTNMHAERFAICTTLKECETRIAKALIRARLMRDAR